MFDSLVLEYNNKGNLSDFFANLEENNKYERIIFDYFHPFFSLMLDKYDICRIQKTYYDKNYKEMISLFSVDIAVDPVEMVGIVYAFLDEICGLFVGVLDPQFFLTTKIELNISEFNYKTHIPISPISFVAVLKLKESSLDGRKLRIEFKFYEVEDESKTSLKLLLVGESSFQKPKLQKVMTKF